MKKLEILMRLPCFFALLYGFFYIFLHPENIGYGEKENLIHCT